METQAVFHFAFAEILQVRLPVAIVAQVVGDVLGEENVARIAAVEDTLRNIDSGAGHIDPIIHVSDLIHRAAMNPHAHRNFWSTSQCFGDFERATHRLFEAFEKEQCHAIASRETNQFVLRFSSPKTISRTDDVR